MNHISSRAHVTQGSIIVNHVDCMHSESSAVLFHIDCTSKNGQVLSYGHEIVDGKLVLSVFLDKDEHTLRTSQLDSATLVEIEVDVAAGDPDRAWDLSVDGGRYTFIVMATQHDIERKVIYSRPTLHQHVSQLAADTDRLPDDLDIDVQREIITLRRAPVHLDMNGDGLPDGPVFASLDAENAPFTGAEHCVFSLASADQTGLSVSAIVDGSALEMDESWSDQVRAAMDKQFGLMLSAIGFARPA